MQTSYGAKDTSANVDSHVFHLSNVNKIFKVSKGLFRGKTKLHAVSGVSLNVQKGQVLGLVGESGCGKSTLAMIMLGLLPPSSGKILIEDKPIEQWQQSHISQLVQPIFQDPYSSLNPRKTIGQIVTLPLKVHKIGNRETQRQDVQDLLEMVGLPKRAYFSYPNQLSGGQRQRVAIARALIMKPKVVICDEPTSALDVSVQSQILNLLIDLREELGLTYVLISHNLAVVEHLATHMAVMYLGRIVEYTDTERLFTESRHPYTRALLYSILLPQPGKKVVATDLGLSFPNPLEPPPGCRFHPRCPKAKAICMVQPPPTLVSDDRYLECHLYS